MFLTFCFAAFVGSATVTKSSEDILDPRESRNTVWKNGSSLNDHFQFDRRLHRKVREGKRDREIEKKKEREREREREREG